MKIDLKNISSITIDPEMMGGMPCLEGYRIPVATMLTEIAENGIHETADEWELPEGELKILIKDIADEIIRVFEEKSGRK